MTLEANSIGVQVKAPCHDRCKGDRASWESPTKYARNSSGQKGVYCTCCEQWLARMPSTEKALVPLPDGVGAEVTILECTNCGFRVESMPEMRAV